MFDDYDDKCAVCSTSQSSASNLDDEMFLVNTDTRCGHRFCQRCIDNQLSRKRNFICPICGTVVSKEKLSTKSLDDCEVEKDVKIRRKVKAIYNKTEEDFDTLLEYQNYEEQVEDIIFNLVHGIDREITENIVKEYQKAHVSEITKKQSRITDFFKQQEELIMQEEFALITRNREIQESLNRDRLEKQERSRQINEFLIGERDRITVGDTKPVINSIETSMGINPNNSTSGMSSSIHPAYLVLNQRPDPKPLETVRGTDLGISSSQHGKLAQIAGGFDQMMYTKRSWREIVTSLPVTLQSKYKRFKHSIQFFSEVDSSYSSMDIDNLKEGSNKWEQNPSSEEITIARNLDVWNIDDSVSLPLFWT